MTGSGTEGVGLAQNMGICAVGSETEETGLILVSKGGHIYSRWNRIGLGIGLGTAPAYRLVRSPWGRGCFHTDYTSGYHPLIPIPYGFLRGLWLSTHD